MAPRNVPTTTSSRPHDVDVSAAPEAGVTAPPAYISISCDDCALRHSAACEDCLVSFVLGREPDDAVVVDVGEARAMRMLTRAGLLPGLRHSGVEEDWVGGDWVGGDWAAS